MQLYIKIRKKNAIYIVFPYRKKKVKHVLHAHLQARLDNSNWRRGQRECNLVSEIPRQGKGKEYKEMHPCCAREMELPPRSGSERQHPEGQFKSGDLV